jgi:hypothetical protein
MDNPSAELLDLTEIFPQDYAFGEHSSLLGIASIPKNVPDLIESGFFSFVHFENLFYGCVGRSVEKESK